MSESLQAEERRLLQQVPAVSVHAKISGAHARSFAAAKSTRCDASANTEPAAMESDGCVTAALAEIEVQRKQLAAKELEIDRYSRQIEQLSEHVAYVNEMLNAREAKLLDFEEQLNGREAVTGKAKAGKKVFKTYCVACHGANAEGNIAMGAPNLKNGIWLYGGSAEQIGHTLRNGRNGVMPAFGDTLSEDKVHILAAYVYGLSQ